MAKKSKIYSDGHLEWAESRLDQFSQNPKGFQLKELIAKLLPKIDAAQEAGYTLDNIAVALGEGDISIAPNTLKQYIQEAKNLKGQPSSSDSRPRSKKSGKLASSKQDSLHSDLEDLESETQEELVDGVLTRQETLEQINQIGEADEEVNSSL